MKLVIFDVDGTISDSQAQICAAMDYGFAELGLPVPPRAAILSIVGLSLPQAVARLVPDQPPEVQDRIVAYYKQSYMAHRKVEAAPLYPGAADLLHRLAAREDLVLGVATGKSRRGLDALIAHHELDGLFVTRQVADDHPSKPHPSMVLTALAETGVAACDAVMIGDTSYDIEMGRAAGVATIGVAWGYHPVGDLVAAGAGRLVEDFAALEAALEERLA
ncbi:MAG: HAD-IA family hydrolase [Sphingomonadales bacterium]|nr:HAD-IA family hydrolase [Sphingomonadales bacterium]